MSYFVFRTLAKMLMLNRLSQVASLSSRCLSSLSFSHHTSRSSASLSQARYLHRSPPRFQSRTPAEEGLIRALAEAFPAATDIAVVDVSGGCGSMYEGDRARLSLLLVLVTTLLRSHWSRCYNSDATPALLCHKEPAQDTQSPLLILSTDTGGMGCLELCL